MQHLRNHLDVVKYSYQNSHHYQNLKLYLTLSIKAYLTSQNAVHFGMNDSYQYHVKVHAERSTVCVNSTV